MSFETVSVIGLGYIGLPTAAVIASRGINVVGVDVNQNAVDTINAGEIHIVEPDLDIAVRSTVNIGKLRATITPEKADAFMVAVPTPFKGDDHEPDLSYIEAAAKAIAPVLEKGNLVILESTSPVGATEKMADWLADARPDLTFPQSTGESADIQVAHCPERVLPGYVMQELLSNDRVIGGISAKCSERANRHPRVNILNPGPGVGGHCIAVDPWFIVNSCPDEANLIKQARLTNDVKPQYVIDQVTKAADEFKRPVVACLGLAFKADIDDLRESPAVKIVEELAKRDVGKLVAVEPNIESLPSKLNDNAVEFASLENALEQANIVVVLVDHKQFKSADKTELAKKVVIDSCGIL
ncbi:UDP-N-acetyl-D-mannosaminuronic acid dehydrogenase [Vibrio coralliirubri]|uniref:UDP binding domain-containing protein n=1 Tax=Vibrio coralliirubri TaxID=1516159 RepID=UPI000637850E|nr:UDP binding domain-containing protein [Vibrio coralliirubri]CDT89261.1 UDP-N-acetyl-D-mannosaminuronic acid dehydrogenase [Vibrio coralliirubri]